MIYVTVSDQLIEMMKMQSAPVVENEQQFAFEFAIKDCVVR